MVPFESMGISAAGREYRMDETFDTHILVHELTHQMMHFWLGLLPQWVVEGVAEYAGRLPFRGGKFRVSEAEAGLKEYVAFRKKRVVGGVPEPYPLDKLFSMTSEEWKEMMASDNSQTQRLYMTSYLLVFYFMHFDGRGDGERFVRYMHASSAPCRQMEAYERELASYNDRVRGKWPEGRAREGGERLGHKIVEGIIQPARKLAQRGDAVLRGRLRRQHIARIDEGEQGLKLVIPVLPPPADMQREVDLGVGGFAHSILPGTGRGTMRSMVEGHAVSSAAYDLPLPLHHPAGGPPPPLGEDRLRPQSVASCNSPGASTGQGRAPLVKRRHGRG